jgi:methylthioribose-1-phosphate isomerase
MNVDGKHYRTIWPHADGESVEVIDQTLLPREFVIKRLTNLSEAAEAIRSMVVRGAPLVGVTAAYGFAIAMRSALPMRESQKLVRRCSRPVPPP